MCKSRMDGHAQVFEGVVNALPKHVKPVIAGITTGIPKEKEHQQPTIHAVKGVATQFASGVFGGANLPSMKGRAK